MGDKMRGLALLAGLCGGIGAILPDIDHILFGERAFFHWPMWLGVMAVLLCLGLYLTLGRRLS